MNLKELKNTPPRDLPQVAAAMRQRIIEAMAKNGGHLASNLGSVELTLALHYVFDTPQDRLVFDVSHQCYTHKLLTNRDGIKFDRIRKTGGLSGFCHPAESPHDHFFAGHAGTALSLALGMAKGRDLVGDREYIIPIIGDASLTCGLTLEALNNVPTQLANFIVILNDNAMSISHNVGGITHILSRLISNPFANKISKKFEKYLSKIPLYGETFVKQKRKLGQAIKSLFGSACFFEHFGMTYCGPVDGHDIHKLISLFQTLKDQTGPVLVHLQTRKGQGLASAEEDPITFHGVKPFDPKTCKFHPTVVTAPTFPKIFGEHLLIMGQQRSNLMVITPAMSLGSCLDPFFAAYPTRSVDVGIAEGHAVTYAAGLAKTKKAFVICSIYATFLQRALDNVFHDVCLQDIPVIFAIDRAGLAAGDGATHHGIYDIGFLKTLPRMVICQPRDGQLLVELLESACQWQTPTAIRYPNLPTTAPRTDKIKTRLLGTAEVLASGDDLVIFALGTMVDTALQVKELLVSKHQICATIVDPIFIKPFDIQLLSTLLLSHTRIVTLEEHSTMGGMGVEITSFIAAHGFENTRVLNIGIPDRFFEHGQLSDLYKQAGLNAEHIAAQILSHFDFSAPFPRPPFALTH